MSYLYKLKKSRCELEPAGRYSRPGSGVSMYSNVSFRSNIETGRRIKPGKRWAPTTETRHTLYSSDRSLSGRRQPTSDRGGRTGSRQSVSDRPARAPSVTSMMLQDMSWNAMVELIGPKKRDLEILRVYVGNGRNFTLPMEQISDPRPKSTKSSKTDWSRNHRLSQRQADVYKDISNVYNTTMAREKREKVFLDKYADRRADMMKEKAIQQHRESVRRIEKKIKIYDEVKKKRLDFAMEKNIRSKVQFVSSKVLEHEKFKGKRQPHYALPDIISDDTKPPPMRRPRRPDLSVDKNRLKEIGKNTHVVYFGPFFEAREPVSLRQRPRKLKALEKLPPPQQRKHKDSQKVTVRTPSPIEQPPEPKQEQTQEQPEPQQIQQPKPETKQESAKPERTRESAKPERKRESAKPERKRESANPRGRRESVDERRSESAASYTVIVAEKITVPSPVRRDSKAAKGRHIYV